jgi:hypothetical protein
MWMKWIAITCFAIGCILIATVFWVGRGQEPLSCAVDLRPDFSVTRTFRVSAEARYRIEIRCSRNMPFEKLKKVLQGGNLISITLAEDGTPVHLQYFTEPVFRPGVVSTDEFGNLGFAQDWISQDIADFPGHRAKIYTITCSVIRPVEELRSTRPTLIVGLDPLEIEGRAFGSLLLFAAAFLCFVLSVVFGAAFLYMRRRAKTRPNQSLQPTGGHPDD